MSSNILADWAKALSGRSGYVYKDCRDYVPHEKQVFLRQTAWIEDKGCYGPVFNLLGVLADVLGAEWTVSKEFDNAFVCLSDIEAECSFYFKDKIDAKTWRAVQEINSGSEYSTKRHDYRKTFEQVAREIEEKYLSVQELAACSR